MKPKNVIKNMRTQCLPKVFGGSEELMAVAGVRVSIPGRGRFCICVCVGD